MSPSLKHTIGYTVAILISVATALGIDIPSEQIDCPVCPECSPARATATAEIDRGGWSGGVQVDEQGKPIYEFKIERNF